MRNSSSGSPTGTAASASATQAQGVYGPQMSDQGTTMVAGPQHRVPPATLEISMTVPSSTTLTTDHPAWTATPTGPARLLTTTSGTWLATWGRDGLNLICQAGSEDHKPVVITLDAEALPAKTPPALAGELAKLGTVQRIATASVWDALSTAILRQVVRAAQARVLYQRWCATYGQTFETAAGRLSSAPTAETVLALSAAEFSAVGAAFFRTALQAAAEAYLAEGPNWIGLPADTLAQKLDEIPRVGPWTAKAAAADHTGDFSIYPHGDLAVRTWANRAAPEEEWPVKDRAFETRWRSLCDGPHQLHALTLLTLTWGSHDRTDPDHGRP